MLKIDHLVNKVCFFCVSIESNIVSEEGKGSFHLFFRCK